jgi:hypothetical protein
VTREPRSAATPVTLPSPVGVPRREPSSAATRTPELTGQRVVLLDNGQASLEQDVYGDVLQWIETGLQSRNATVIRQRAGLVAYETAQLAELDAGIRSLDPVGVVIALCHAGVTAPSALLATSLERSGIPCVLVCTPLGQPLASMMTANQVPDLPLPVAHPLRELPDSAIEPSQAALVSDVLRSLTGAPTGVPSPVLAAERPSIVVELPEAASSWTLDDVVGFHDRVWEELLGRRIGDGLPVVVPTVSRVEQMLASCDRDPDEVLISEPTPNGAPVTVGLLAVNAVLAGCLPEYFPIVVAAADAMGAEEFRFFQTSVTTHPGGIAVVVSGPLARKLGIQAGPGCLGPGFRANATIGRAVRFVFSNIVQSIPGLSSLAIFGSPAQFTFCFAELEESPWPTRNVDLYDSATTAVTVLKCESPHNVLSNAGNGPKPVLRTTASVLATLGTNAIRYPGDHLVLINPDKARMFANSGFSKGDIQQYLFDKARVPASEFNAASFEHFRPVWTRFTDSIPVVRDPSEFHILVAGGVGNQLMVAPPWGLSRAVTRPVSA